MNLPKANICRWLERVFPNGLTEEDKAKLNIQVGRMDSLGWIFKDKENLYAPKIGTIVDIATNFELYGYKMEIVNDVLKAMKRIEKDLLNSHEWFWEPSRECRYSKYDYRIMIQEDLKRLADLRTEIEWRGLTDKAIGLINYLVKYLDFARQGYKNLWKTVEADEKTIGNIRIMVSRTVFFIKNYYRDAQGSLMFAESDMCKNISTGSIDFYTNETMIDIKVKSTAGIWDRDIRQMIVYYLLGKKNGFDFQECVIFNPRIGEWYKFKTKDIPSHLIEEIESKW